ncbi:adenyl-nucleotide exchange factor sse1 [Emmonsiellopsis sp. PD_33]|nr:adenyl-nucleotide exchange factor sse1 [Emmonsiellopsis sp. PD_33]
MRKLWKQAMDTDAPNGDADAKPKMRKVKKQVRKGDLPISSGTGSLDTAAKDRLSEKENSMFMEDKLVADTEDKKNELESFIYELRDKIEGVYAEYANEEEKTRLKAKLDETEDWLYEDGEDTTKAVYVAKMDEVRFLAGPIIGRHLEKLESERMAKVKAQEEAIAMKRAQEEMAKKAAAAALANDTEMKDADANGNGKDKDEPMPEVEEAS